MIPNILNALSRAIRERRAIAIRYYHRILADASESRQIRVVEPHAVYTNERGELVVDCYQTRGYSSAARPPPFWRPFRLKRIAAISILKEKFEVRTAEGFRPNRSRYRNGLVAMIEHRRAYYVYPEHVLQEMGPFLQTPTERLR